MDNNLLFSTLSTLPLKEIKYLDTIGSTNEYALTWAKAGAGDYSLVVADAQTAGRGRMGRKWVTTPNASLAFSLIIHPRPEENAVIRLFSPLGSLAVAETLRNIYGINDVTVKWPNDVLINQQKVAGILVESTWLGDKAQVIVAGIGVNIAAESVPPADQLLFPATSIEQHLEKSPDRIQLLSQILKSILEWREHLYKDDFLEAWDQYLAFRGQWVHVQQSNQWSVSGELIGIDKFGNLRIRTQQGGEFSVAYGDVHLRPIEKPE